MPNVYVRSEVELELLQIAAEENEKRKAVGMKADITDAIIIQRIVYAWYKQKKGKRRNKKCSK